MLAAPDNQYRAFCVTHDVAGVRAEEVGLQCWTMGHHHDEIGVHQFRLFENLVINAALPDHSRQS